MSAGSVGVREAAHSCAASAGGVCLVQDLAKGRQIGLANAQELAVAHGRERPVPDPLLHGPLVHAQQFGDFAGGVQRPDLRRVRGDNSC